MSDPWQVCPDVTMTITDRDADRGMIASNHRARRHVWLDRALIGLLLGEDATGPFSAADLSSFSNEDGLLADPSGFDRLGAGRPVELADVAAAVDYLTARFILIRDRNDYAAYFAEKTSILDGKHFGTFHQQLGEHLRLKQRKDPDAWWYAQKFNPDTGRTRDNLYKFVQESFLDLFFPTLDVAGKTVLDFGCGSGMASQRFTSAGARVIGVDPDPIQLDRARVAAGPSFSAVHFDLTSSDPLALLPQGPVDLIWMADVFLFYFHPMAGGAPPISPGKLLTRLTAALRPGGRLIIMQPHGVFWLAPWLGAPEQPFTILTEYATRLYSVTPSLERLSAAIAEAGLAITRIHEPRAEDGDKSDLRAAVFAREFPLWWVFECCK